LLQSSNSTLPPRLADLDIAARSVISARSQGLASDPDFSVFTHRLGHGIGLQGHEAPYIVQGSLGDKSVRAGHVFSLEPGIYIPADKEKEISGIGVRLEDCFVVTEDEHGRLGGEWLSGPVHAWGEI
jgi:Xaa-Pro aminopeptidase